MNGVRRLLGGGINGFALPGSQTPPQTPPKTQAQLPPLQTTTPLSVPARSSESPSPPNGSGQLPGSPTQGSPKTTTAGLFLRKDKHRPPPFPSSDEGSHLSPISPTSTSQTRPLVPARVSQIARRSPNGYNGDNSRASIPANTRDNLLISLLSSEAVVESRDYEVLDAEEVEELKKEQKVLQSRQVAMTKKLNLETKIRDAALSLSKVNASYKRMSKQTSEQLDAAERKVDAAQKELWRVSERANEVNRKLLEHRAAVLSFSVAAMDKSMSTNTDSGRDTPDGLFDRNSQMSPAHSSVTSASTPSRARFDGAHLFAGHENAIAPRGPRAPASDAEISALEAKLRAATDALSDASKKQADMGRELSMLRLEREQVETSMSMELQSAEEAVEALERELSNLRGADTQLQALLQEKAGWEQEKGALSTEARQLQALQQEKVAWENERGVHSAQARQLQALQQDKAAWEKEQSVYSTQARQLQSLQQEKAAWDTTFGQLQALQQEKTAWEREKGVHATTLGQLHALQQEKAIWERERGMPGTPSKEQQALQRQLDAKEREARELRMRLEDERQENRLQFTRQNEEIGQLRIQMDEAQQLWEREKVNLTRDHSVHMQSVRSEMEMHRRAASRDDESLEALRALAQRHGIVLTSRDFSVLGFISSIGAHLEGLSTKTEAFARAEKAWEATRQKMQADIQMGLDKRETLAQELEEARREREEARKESRVLLEQSPRPSRGSVHSADGDFSDEASRIISVLQLIWSVLPSPEARAIKMGARSSGFRAGSQTPGSVPNSPKVTASLSDLDVRTLKSLYDPSSAKTPVPSGSFSIEAFAARIQALIADDRALIERLVRFAQAHDLLKKNAERAQKLAQESNSALETYQKQVRMLEEHTSATTEHQTALEDEVRKLQEALERLDAEKQALEIRAAGQADTLRHLTEANNALSAKSLALAQEAAAVGSVARRQIETELADCRGKLNVAQEELDAIRSSEQTQRIALLDELNTMQTENNSLRAQLRARSK